jgi:superfamily II DNA or RNA helicase
MIPPITDSLINDMIQTENMVRAGQGYWRQGQVLDLAIDAELGVISAKVRGSVRRPYDVLIIFNEDDADEIFEVDCSCPVGFGCKHCAAVFYAARDELGTGIKFSAPSPKIALPKAPPPARPAPLPQPLLYWLSEAQDHEPERQANAPEIAYVLTPHVLHSVKKPKGQPPATPPLAMPYWVSAKVWFKQPNPDNRLVWSEPNRYDHSWTHQAPAAPTSLDAWLIKRLTDYHGDIGGGTPKGIGGADWIDKAIVTGNARWRNPDGPVLHMAEQKDASFRWVTVGTGEQRLTLDDVPPGMTLVALASPLLINVESGAVHRLETGVEGVLAERLLRLPPVPPHAVQAMAEQWQRVAGDAVQPPALHNLIDKGMITPTPVLTFREEGVDIFLPQRSRYYAAGTVKTPMATARLSFDYVGYPVTHATDATLILNVTEEGTLQFQRDLAAEEHAFARMARLGLKPIRTFHEAKAKAAQAWDLAIEIGATPAHYADILQNHVPRLQEEGWRIAYAPRWSLAFVEIEPDSLSFDVEPSGIDWFDISLGARIDGKEIDILPILRRLLAQHGAALLDHPGATLSFEIARGKLAQVPMEKIKPVLEMLLLFALQDRYGNEKLRMPARDLAALADFESGTNAYIPWTGAEALRSLAKALAQMELAPTKTPKSFTATLRPYQQQGLDWLQALHGAGFGGVLADDMGLGKTVQALAHITTLKAAKALKLPVLIVCPTSVLPNWQAELAQLAPKLTTLLWHGATRKTLAPKIAKQDVILTSYPLLIRDSETLKEQPFSLIIHDEAQMLKNPKTAGFKAARQMKAVQTIALTGTPVENQLTDAWSLMELVTPGLLGTLDQFNRTIAKPITRENDGGAKRALARRLRPFMLRRTKDQVASDLPAKTEIPEWIDLDGAQLALYESMRLLMQKKVREEIARVGLMRSHIVFLDALLKLRQICCDPRLLQNDTPAASAKLSRLMEMLPELLAEGRKVILFSQFTSMLDLIKPELGERGIAFTEIRGSTKDRLAPVKAFQAGAVPLILVSLKAGGTGLNLTAADTVILYDPWWNPAVEAQAIDRAHRIGQTKPVFVHRLIARGTIEEKILSLQDKKRSLAATLWGEGEDGAAPAKLTEADVRFLLG